MRVLYCEDELDTLDQVSLPAERLYRQIRRRMDMKSCTVGRGASKISRGVLALYCQYIPPRGSKNPTWKPSLYQIDALLDELVRNGLIERIATPQERQKMVLFLPKALVRPLEEHDMNTTDEHYTNNAYCSNNNQQLAEVSDREEPGLLHCNEADISQYLFDEMRASSAERGVDKSTEGVDSQVSAARKEAIQNLKIALTAEELADSCLFQACAALGDEVALRAVSAAEIRQAVYMARERGARSVVAYATTIIREGSLVATEQSPKKSLRATSVSCPMPASFPLTQRHQDIALSKGLAIQSELEKFMLNAKSKARRSADWSAEFELWLLRHFAGKGAADMPWYVTATGIEKRAEEIGYAPPQGVPLGVWKYDVFKQCGVTEEMHRRASSDFR